MRIIKRILLFLLILAIALFFLRGWIFRSVVTYRSIGTRTQYAVTDSMLRSCIMKAVKKYLTTTPRNPFDEKAIVELALDITAEKLNFTDGKNHTDPNLLIHSKTANCVGYAAFCVTICNHVLREDTWTAIPQIGQLYFLGINVHSYFSSPFFKDHDFVLIKNLKTGEVFAVDPSVYDYTGIELVTYTPN